MTKTDFDAQQAATEWWNTVGVFNMQNFDTSNQQDNEAAFAAGAAWQKEREAVNVANDAAIERHNELRDALGTLGEGMAATLQGIKSLQEAGLRGGDRGVAILKHLQEIGDNVRGVSGSIGDKFGVVLDAIKHVGETTEAVLDEVTTPEVVNVMETTEPMHAEVKAEPTSGLGKLWADVPVNLEDVSDETLSLLHRSDQITTARFIEETERRAMKEAFGKPSIGVAPAHGADAMAYTFMRGGKTLGEIRDMGATCEGFAVAAIDGGRVIVLHRGRLYDLRGMDLIPLRIGA